MVDILASKSTLIQVCDDNNYPYGGDSHSSGGSYQYQYQSQYSFDNPYDHQNTYYSDVAPTNNNKEEEEGGSSSTNLYMRYRFICDNIVDGKWKPEEEQEVSVFVREFGYEDDLSNKPLPKAPSSTYASSSISSDSFYSEPIYGITNQITNKSSSTKSSSSSTYAPPVPDTRRPSFPHPPQSVISCNNVIRHDPVIPLQRRDPGGNQLPIYADSTTPANDFVPSDKLPPLPPSRLAVIAKSAGKKFAKKFMGIRKLSKSSLESLESPTSSSQSPSPIGINANTHHNHHHHGRGTPASGGSGPGSLQSTSISPTPSKMSNGTTIYNGQSTCKKPISRPNMPPPEPPKNGPQNNNNDSHSHKNNNNKSDPSSSSPHSADTEDDFDDSDFYDSDSELIRNFVAQVQPIYSMEEEPLYQYYAYGISIKPDDDYQPVIPKNLGLTLDMLVPRVGQRTLWCELPEVISSGILSILSDKQKQLQEAIFEILTSEVSYLKSLDVLLDVFYKNKELVGLLNGEEREYVFGNISDVRECAHSFLKELLGKWEESWYIQEIGDVINHNANTRFIVYKEYCRNKPHQDKVIAQLRHSRDEFVNVIKTLEEDPRCQMLRMDSFLMLPMQRITRLPLLVNAVIQRTISTKEKGHCEEALKSLTNLVLECNEAARETQDAEETSSILEKLEFGRGSPLPPKPLSTFGQFLMKGDFMKNPFDSGRGGGNHQININWTFRKNKRTIYWLLLFTQQLLVTKKKTNGKFEVLDQSSPEDANIKPLPNLEGISNDFQNFFMLHFDKKETVYFLAARTTTEIDRWKNKLETLKKSSPPSSSSSINNNTDNKKKLQVEPIFPYEAGRPDELSLGVGDVIEVSQMQPDGWYYGMKLNGGESGWFPANYCSEV